MKNPNVNRIVMAFALCIAVTGLSSKAHAEFTVEIDNFGHTPEDNPAGSPTWAASSNYIHIIAWVGPYNQPAAMNYVAMNRIREEQYRFTFTDDMLPYGTTSWSDVNSIQIINTGGDLFWIDQLNLYDAGMTLRKSWGSDNGYGWCISTDSSDRSNRCCFPCNTNKRATPSVRLYR